MSGKIFWKLINGGLKIRCGGCELFPKINKRPPSYFGPKSRSFRIICNILISPRASFKPIVSPNFPILNLRWNFLLLKNSRSEFLREFLLANISTLQKWLLPFWTHEYWFCHQHLIHLSELFRGRNSLSVFHHKSPVNFAHSSFNESKFFV